MVAVLDTLTLRQGIQMVRQNAYETLGGMDSNQIDNETTQAGPTLRPQTAPCVSFSPGQIIRERFRIVRQLGEGGMAVVYEAIDEKLGERRALKFAKAGHSAQITPEARSALRITHENICRTYEIHTTEKSGVPALDFISMELVEGETLESRYRREVVSQPEAVAIARQLCQGLEAAHRAQVLHRDLKGNNVMLARRSDGSVRVVITDFGLAKLTGAGAAPTTSAITGTPNYIAPERWKDLAATPTSDVYALGVILYEMLANRLPFSPEVPLSVRLTSLPDAPSKSDRRPDSRWDSIVLGCLHPDPGKRISAPSEALRLIDRAFAISYRNQWIAAALAIFLAASSSYYFRETIFPPPPLARLAILPFTVSAGSAIGSELNIKIRGGLSDVAARLRVLGAASRRLVIITPEEIENYKVDSPASAAKILRATHVFSGEIETRGNVTRLHATIVELNTGNILRRFDGEFRTLELASVSTSLASVVSSAFHLGSAPPVSIQPEAYSEYAHGLALLRRDLSSYEEAITHFKAAEEIDPRSPLVFAGLAEGYFQKFKATMDPRWLQEASSVADRSESLHPDSVPVLLVLSSIEQTEGKPERAIARLQRAAELEPNNSDVWRQMGTALDNAGRIEEAVGALRKAIVLAPDYFRPHRDLGTFYGRKGRFIEAIQEYRIVTQLAPNLAEGYSDLGGVLLAAEKQDEAEVALRQSLRLRETRSALNNLGVLLRYENRDAEAAPIMERGLAAGADDATIRLNLANALRRAGHIAEARQNYQRASDLARAALLLNPRDAISRARLAYSMVQLGTPALAADEALQAVRLASSDYYTLYWTIMTLDSIGRRAEAYPLLDHISQQQLKDLRRQPDLAEFTGDPRFPRTQPPTPNERTTNDRN
jgi:serine/threonine protein kinase/Flp pilus assembly protein TadD